jgi:hypothetical protein
VPFFRQVGLIISRQCAGVGHEAVQIASGALPRAIIFGRRLDRHLGEGE